MSWIRPEAQAQLLRLVEPVIATTLAALLLIRGWAVYGYEWAFGTLMLIAGSLVALWALAAWVRAVLNLRRTRGAPGVLIIEEERIGYLGPESGGFVALDSIDRVELIEGVWILHTGADVPLAIPSGAEGADQLPDALGSLPGFDARVLLRAAQGGTQMGLWRRPARTAAARRDREGPSPPPPLHPPARGAPGGLEKDEGKP